ncbi:MAG: PilZ domain-containing protein [Clostridia bacterium]|nr:PilZ domain-containing protein [Clostridia bacterium]
MNLTDLQIGVKLELQLYDENGEAIKPQFVSELEWVEEGVAFIAAPIHEGVIFPVHIGTTMNVFFIHKDDLYKFKAKVLNRGVKDNIAYLKVSLLSELEKIQRRQFFRFECSTPIKYKVLDYYSQKDTSKIPFKKATTRDLSGGGLCISTDEKVDLNKLVECELDLDEGKSVKFVGQIVRSDLIKLEDVIRYELGVLFKKIEYKDREAVIGFIFREQRKLRKKGLI